MQSISLFTIGYESKNIEDFVGQLQEFGIRVVIDIRETPISRKPGFSKSKLKEHLKQFDIKYIHTKELGSPKNLRKKFFEDSDFDYFSKEYGRYLKTQTDILVGLYRSTVMHEACCLMCMEKAHTYCHRRIVADKIKEIDGNGLIIKHL